MTRFSGQVVIVTGAASGFGEAIARRFADEGASVVLADIDEGRGKELAAEIAAAGGQATFVRTDVSISEDVEALIDSAVARYGGLDGIVNNAGIAHRTGSITELSEADYDRVFAVNTKSVYLAARFGVPKLRERGGGFIVNTASIGAVAPRPGVAVYNASKGAVVTLTRGLAVRTRTGPNPRQRSESGRRGYRVHAKGRRRASAARCGEGAAGARDSARAPHRATRRRRLCALPGLERGRVPDRSLPRRRRRPKHLVGGSHRLL